MKHKREIRKGIVCWYCPNCGQTYFGDEAPPDMCDYCGDFTTWKPLHPEAPRSQHDDDDSFPIQLPLL